MLEACSRAAVDCRAQGVPGVWPVSSPKAGLWMGGMNENWLILYSRFVVGSGPGVFAKTASFDHIIRGNVFVFEMIAPAVIERFEFDNARVDADGARPQGMCLPTGGDPGAEGDGDDRFS